MAINCINDEYLKNILNRALEQFYINDEDLIACKGMEQACVFRIGLYVHELLKMDTKSNNLNLDCEYNKNGCGAKVTPRFRKGARPDLIIHERSLDAQNYNNKFIIEFKGWWNKATQRDIEKLEDFTDSQKGYNYQLGALVILTRYYEKLDIRYFKNGKELIKNAF